MTDFVSEPPPKRPRIPVPTAQELADAFKQFLKAKAEAAIFFPYMDLSGFREYNETVLSFTTKLESDPSSPVDCVRLVIDGKACQTWTSRLWSTPFDVWVRSKWLDIDQPFQVEPQPNRAIAFRPTTGMIRPVWVRLRQ